MKKIFLFLLMITNASAENVVELNPKITSNRSSLEVFNVVDNDVPEINCYLLVNKIEENLVIKREIISLECNTIKEIIPRNFRSKSDVFKSFTLGLGQSSIDRVVDSKRNALIYILYNGDNKKSDFSVIKF